MTKNGTVTDHLTSLMWLKNADCFGNKYWDDALDDSNNVADGQCGLSDGSSINDWRLPNVREHQSLIDYTRRSPALPLSHPFMGVSSGRYWTSTGTQIYTGAVFAWSLSMYSESIQQNWEGEDRLVWPVRGGN